MMIDGVHKKHFFTDLPPLKANSPSSIIRQGDSLSSPKNPNQSLCGVCFDLCKYTLAILFFPITIPYLIFKSLYCPNKPNSAFQDGEETAETMSVGTYRSPFPKEVRSGEHKTEIVEESGLPMEIAAKHRNEKLGVAVDLSRDHEKALLIPHMQLLTLIEKSLSETQKKGRVSILTNFSLTPKNLSGTVEIDEKFRAHLILFQSRGFDQIESSHLRGGVYTLGSDPTKRVTEEQPAYKLRKKFLEQKKGSKIATEKRKETYLLAPSCGTQVEKLKEELRGQLFAAQRNEVEVLILDYYGSHHGTPSKAVRLIYEQLLEKEFKGCFKTVIFVKRSDDDAPKTPSPKRSALDAVQLRDLN